MPRKRKVPRSARSIRQKNRKYETQCNNMEAFSDSIPPSNNQPLNVEPQVVACDQKISTRASLRLKRKREQSYETYYQDPQAKRAKVKDSYLKNPEVKCKQVKVSFNKDRQAKRDKVKAAFDKDRVKKRAQVKSLYYRNPQVKKANIKARYWKNAATKRVASNLLARAKRVLNPKAKKIENKA